MGVNMEVYNMIGENQPIASSSPTRSRCYPHVPVARRVRAKLWKMLPHPAARKTSPLYIEE